MTDSNKILMRNDKLRSDSKALQGLYQSSSQNEPSVLEKGKKFKRDEINYDERNSVCFYTLSKCELIPTAVDPNI